MSKRQTIAVIIAAYNAEKTISRAIESVINDKFVSQIIIVDDCSTDTTKAIASSYQKLHPFISVYSTPVNSGPSKARNIALSHCIADWVTVLDSDDFIEEGRFEKLLAYKDDYQLIADEQYRIFEGQPSSSKTRMFSDSYTFPREISLVEFICSNISHKGKPRQELGFIKPIIKRDFLLKHKLNYQENMRLGEDYELYCRCLALGAKLQLIKAAGYVAVVRKNSLSGSHSQHDLVQLRDCDYQIIKSLNLAGKESKLLKEHAISIDVKIQWIEFYSQLKGINVVKSVKALFSSYRAFVYITGQLSNEFSKRLLKRKM